MEVIKHSKKHPKRPAWFEDFYENDYKVFQQKVLKKFDDMDKKMPAWFEYFIEHEFKPMKKLLSDVIKLNNLKTHE